MKQSINLIFVTYNLINYKSFTKMKKFLLLGLILFSSHIFADVITIDGLSYDVEIRKVKKSKVILEFNNEIYSVPFDDIESLYLVDGSANYNKNTETLLNLLKEENPCVRGAMDAQMRGKTAINVVGGMFFGPFAMIHKLVKDFHPMNDFNVMAMQGNTELMKDPSYVECYRKKARSKALTANAGGWGAWIILVIAASSN